MLVRGHINSLNFIEPSKSIGVRVFPIQKLFKDDIQMPWCIVSWSINLIMRHCITLRNG